MGPPNWIGKTVICIASGPSLLVEDCERARASGHPVIVTNTTFRLCPWADALFGFDARWWKLYHEEVFSTFAGRKVSSSQLAGKYGVEVIPRRYRNSGACSVSWAIDQGAAKIILLGFDSALGRGGESHHHGDHPEGLRNVESINDWPRQFALLAKHAMRRGVKIVNASCKTALKCFPVETLSNALREASNG